MKKDKPIRQSLHQVVIPADRGEDGVPQRPAFTDMELAERVGIEAPPRCEAHRLVDCATCRPVVESKSAISSNIADVPDFPGSAWGSERNQGSETYSLYYEPAIVVKPKRVREETLDEEKQRKIEERRDRLIQVGEHLQKQENLRAFSGYSVRQLARVLITPGFIPATEKPDFRYLMCDEPFVYKGKRARKSWREIKLDIGKGERKRRPRTMDELVECLPRIFEPALSPEKVALYKDYAAGNVKKMQIETRMKAAGITNWVETENWIIRRAWDLNLLRQRDTRSSNLPSALEEKAEVDHDQEIHAIKRGIMTIGQVVKAKHGRPLYSFEGGKQYGPGQVPKTGGDFASGEFDGAHGGDFQGLEDSYGESSGDDIKRLD